MASLPALLAAALVGVVPAAAPAPPQARCAVADARLAELSGLAVVGGPTRPPPGGAGPAAGSGEAVWAMADGGRRVALHRLDPATCAVVETRTASVDPYDAEDLAAAPDGTLWVGDTGDNDRRRATIAVIAVPARGPAALHRLTYPDGPHDAEALLLDAGGVPTVVTKDVGAAGVYRPEGPLTGEGPTPLVRVGDVVLPPSDTVGGPIGGFGSRTVTGGAVTRDGRVVALRTYTDAWLFAAPDGAAGDVVAALRTSPVRVPLPEEPQGEAIAFTADGTLLSGSESRGTAAGELRAVPGAAALAAPAARSGAPSGPATPAPTAGMPPADAPPEPPPATTPVTPGWAAAVGAGATVGVLGLLAAVLAGRARRDARRRTRHRG